MLTERRLRYPEKNYCLRKTPKKLKKKLILPDTKITIRYYRLITGACEQGIKNYMNNNPGVKEGIRAKELLPILKKKEMPMV